MDGVLKRKENVMHGLLLSLLCIVYFLQRHADLFAAQFSSLVGLLP